MNYNQTNMYTDRRIYSNGYRTPINSLFIRPQYMMDDFNSGDPTMTYMWESNDQRKYQNLNRGDIQYYYPDVDNFGSPNFITSSKVDFSEYTDPMGRVIPQYRRSLTESKEFAENKFLQDSTDFREDIMERQMSKINSQMWQSKIAPISRGARLSSFKSGM